MDIEIDLSKPKAIEEQLAVAIEKIELIDLVERLSLASSIEQNVQNNHRLGQILLLGFVSQPQQHPFVVC